MSALKQPGGGKVKSLLLFDNVVANISLSAAPGVARCTRVPITSVESLAEEMVDQR